MLFCGQCGAEVSKGTFCGRCGAAVRKPRTPMMEFTRQTTQNIPKEQMDSQDELGNVNLLAMLAYMTFVPALVFLLFEPFSKNRYLRFHCYQSLFLFVGAFCLEFASISLSFLIVFEGLLMGFLTCVLVVMWLIAVYKAWQGEQYKLPIFGVLAARHSAS